MKNSQDHSTVAARNLYQIVLSSGLHHYTIIYCITLICQSCREAGAKPSWLQTRERVHLGQVCNFSIRYIKFAIFLFPHDFLCLMAHPPDRSLLSHHSYLPGRAKAITFILRGMWSQLTASFRTTVHRRSLEHNTHGERHYPPTFICINSVSIAVISTWVRVATPG